MAPRCFAGAAGRMELSLTVEEQTVAGAGLTGCHRSGALRGRC